MKLDMRYGHHPDDVKHYDTAAKRRHFLVEDVFVIGELALVYTHVDRVVFGGAVPTTQALALKGGKEFGTDNFLDRRELGVVNLGATGAGAITKGPLITDDAAITVGRSCAVKGDQRGGRQFGIGRGDGKCGLRGEIGGGIADGDRDTAGVSGAIIISYDQGDLVAPCCAKGMIHPGTTGSGTITKIPLMAGNGAIDVIGRTAIEGDQRWGD